MSLSLHTVPCMQTLHTSTEHPMSSFQTPISLIHFRPKYNRLVRMRKTLKLHVLLIVSSLKGLVTIAVILEAPELKIFLDVFSRTASGDYSGIISRHCWQIQQPFSTPFSIAACRYWKARFGRVIQFWTMRHRGNLL